MKSPTKVVPPTQVSLICVAAKLIETKPDIVSIGTFPNFAFDLIDAISPQSLRSDTFELTMTRLVFPDPDTLNRSASSYPANWRSSQVIKNQSLTTNDVHSTT